MATHKTDEALIEHIRKEAPEILERELDFHALATKVIAADPISVDPVIRRAERRGKTRKRPPGSPK